MSSERPSLRFAGPIFFAACDFSEHVRQMVTPAREVFDFGRPIRGAARTDRILGRAKP